MTLEEQLRDVISQGGWVDPWEVDVKQQVADIMAIVDDAVKKAKIDGGKDVFDCFRDLWGNPPVETLKQEMHEEDIALLHWHADELYEMLDELEADWLSQQGVE